MDAGGYNIENIGVLELADDVVLGAECDQKYIGTTVTGMLVSCVGASEITVKIPRKRASGVYPMNCPWGLFTFPSQKMTQVGY